MKEAFLGLLACASVSCGEPDSLESPVSTVQPPVVVPVEPRQECTQIPPTDHHYIPFDFNGVDAVFDKYGFTRVDCPPVSVRCDDLDARPHPSRCFEGKKGSAIVNFTIYCTETSVHSVCLLDKEIKGPDGSVIEAVTATAVPRRRGSCDLNCNLDSIIRPKGDIQVQLP